jgi:hypothetical protein
MYVPHSITKDKWASLDRYSTKIFSDNFCHDYHLTLKANGITTQASSIRFRERLNWRKDTLQAASEMRVWFPVDGYNTVYVKLTDNLFKLHGDFGVTKLNDYKFNTYGTFSMSRRG